jgi:hypothetical protein
MYWDNVNNRLGIGTNAPTNPLSISSTSSSIFDWSRVLGNSGYLAVTNIRTGGGQGTVFGTDIFSFRNGTTNYIVSENNRLGVNTNNDTLISQLQIKGTGSTSATTSLLVQNSGGVDLLKVTDNGVLTLGTFASGLGKIVVTSDPSYGIKTIMENNFGGQIIRQVSTDIIWFGGQTQTGLFANNLMNLVAPSIYGNNPAGNTTGSSFDFRVTGSPYGQTPSTASRGVLFDGSLNFQSGGYANYFELSPTYSFDVSNNRIVKGIYYNPTLVTPNTNDKHIAIETVTGDVLFGTTSGRVGIGTSSPTNKLQVAGTANVTFTGNNNHGVIFSVLNTDSANNTFGLTVGTYSDGLGNRNLELSGSNTINSSLMGDWTTNGWMRVISGLMGTDHDSLRLRQQQSNNIDTGIVLYNTNNTYQMQIWRDGNVSIADTSYSTSASVTSRLFVKGKGSTSATTSLLVQNSAGSQGLKIADDLGFQIGALAAAGAGQSIRTDSGGGGINAGINTNFNNGATWNDDANVCALKIAYNNGIRIANTTRYPLTLGSDTKAVASAQLEMVSTTQGFLPPRMTTAQKNAISSPANGLIVYDTDLVRPCFFNGATWITL